MLISGVNFPEELTNAIKDNKLVVFVGAGVSMGKPTNLPNFTELVNYIANETGYNFDEKINQYDAFLGKLEHNGIDVKRKAAECIIEKQAKPNELHKSIINLFGTKNVIRIVTTNYDQMIEKAIKKKSVLIYNAPALPLGNDFEGIVHIHGNQTDPKRMILTDSDFGDAYLLEGYATRFLSKLFSEYAVLFIGYSYGDTVMTYLSRALPDKQSKKKFILTDDNKKEWDMLGIIPITFPKDNHNILYQSVKEYGFRVNRNMISWKNRCIELSIKPPVNDPEGIDEIKELFLKPEVLSLFLDNLGDKNYNEWVDWFWKNGYLDFVTEDKVLDNLDLLMSNWLIKTDVKESSLEKIIFLIFERNNKINHNFGLQLLQHLHYDDLSDDVYIKSIILFGDILREVPEYQLLDLMECCLKRGLNNLALNIFKIIMEPTFKLKPSYKTTDKEIMYEGSYNNLDEIYVLKEIWGKYIIDNLDYFAYDIVIFLASLMEKRQVGFELFNKENKLYDVDTIYKDIETEITNLENEESIIFICRMILEALDYINLHDEITYKSLINRFVVSPSYTLNRIVLISLRKSGIYNGTEKMEIILKYYDLFEFNSKIEIFRITADIFGNIKSELQNAVLLKMVNRIDKTRNKDVRFKENYPVYNWLVYLISKNPETNLLKDTYDKYVTLFSGFKPREHPELSVYVSGPIWMKDESPITIKQLESMTIDEIYTYIENYNDDNSRFDYNVTKQGLLEMIFVMTSNNFKKNRELMKKYVKHKNYKSIVWEYLLKDLGKNDFKKNGIKFILNLINSKELVKSHGIIVSCLMKDLIDNNDFFINYFKEFEQQILEIIDLLYNNPTYNIKDDKSIIMITINSTIANTVNSLLLIINKGKIEEGISLKYKEIIKGYLKNSKNIELACLINIMFGSYRILYARDELWVKSDIFPYLKSNESTLFQGAWEGMLIFNPTIYADVAINLHDYYYAGIERIEEFNDEVQKRFVESLAILLMHSIPKPNAKFIPEFYIKTSNELKIVLLRKIYLILKNMSIEERNDIWGKWLFKFVANREKNIPALLQDNELECIIGWLPYSGNYFSKIVDLVSKFAPIRINYINRIKSVLDLIRTDPQYCEMNTSKIQLLSYILKCDFTDGFNDNEIKNFYDTIVLENEEDKEEIISEALEKHINL